MPPSNMPQFRLSLSAAWPGPERALPTNVHRPQPPYRQASTHTGTHCISLRPPQLPLSVPAPRPLTHRRYTELFPLTSLREVRSSFLPTVAHRSCALPPLRANRRPVPTPLRAYPVRCRPTPNATHNPAYQAAHAPQSRFRALLCACGWINTDKPTDTTAKRPDLLFLTPPMAPEPPKEKEPPDPVPDSFYLIASRPLWKKRLLGNSLKTDRVPAAWVR
ncbi:hypothetical protein C8J57DRAFT_1515120 [Mycena rebaudengoi]|nr:hypothetical protein C8J57DRAFT_1515120 [Mycena rebaudengoi]